MKHNRGRFGPRNKRAYEARKEYAMTTPLKEKSPPCERTYKFSKIRTLKNIFGAVLILAATALSFLTLPKCGMNMWVFLTMSLIFVVGGHLFSHTTAREFVKSAILIVDAWKGKEI